MLTTKGAFFIAALLSFVMFFVVYSVKDSRVHGVRGLLSANLLGLSAHILYAYQGTLPSIVAYEVANAMYASAAAATFVTFRRLFGKPPAIPLLTCAVGALTALIAIFHYGFDSFTGRTVVASGFQATIAAAIGYTVYTSKQAWSYSRYPFLFVVSLSSMVTAGHGFRLLQQFFGATPPRSLHDLTETNVLLIAAGAFALPLLALGALLIIHRKIVALAEHAANHDFLTGALSRRAFFNFGDHEIARADRTRQPLSVLLIDLDNMKAINDSLGHAAGDEALKAFVNRVTTGLRINDYLARIGGDEFAVLLPDTNLDAAVTLAERLRLQAGKAKEKVGSEAKASPVAGFSIGVSSLRPNESFDSLLKRADAALYRAKAGGRNEIAVAGEAVAA